MEKLNIGIDLEAIFQINELNNGIYSKGVLFSFFEKIVQLNHPVIELFIFSTESSSISSLVFESLSAYNVNVNQVIFTDTEPLPPYLQQFEVEVYLSVDSKRAEVAQTLGILSGFIPIHASFFPLSVVFDHRLFLDEVTYNGLGKFLPFLGYLQQQDKQSLSVELMTTRSYSVDRSIKELFKNAECKINAMCFIASGKGEDLIDLFRVSIYFEGQKRPALSSPPLSECLLNIDF